VTWTISTWPDRQEVAALTGSEFDHPRRSGGVFCLSCQAREGDETSARGRLVNFFVERFLMSRFKVSGSRTRASRSGYLAPGRSDKLVLCVESAGGRELRILEEIEIADLRSFYIEVDPGNGFSMYRRRFRPSKVFWIGLTLMAVAWPGTPPDQIPSAATP